MIGVEVGLGGVTGGVAVIGFAVGVGVGVPGPGVEVGPDAGLSEPQAIAIAMRPAKSASVKSLALKFRDGFKLT